MPKSVLFTACGWGLHACCCPPRRELDPWRQRSTAAGADAELVGLVGLAGLTVPKKESKTKKKILGTVAEETISHITTFTTLSRILSYGSILNIRS